MANKSLKNASVCFLVVFVFVCLCFQIVYYQFAMCQIDKSTTSGTLDLEVFLTPPVCGVRDSNLDTDSKLDIAGGIRPIHVDLAWNAMVGYKRGLRGGPMSWRCGGSLVSQRHVLTAAHCIHGVENELDKVRLGKLNPSLRDEDTSPNDVPIKKGIAHEDYDVMTSTNDIGLLILSEDVEFTNFIRPICLTTRPDLLKESFMNYEAFITEWKTTEWNGDLQRYRQITLAQVFNHSICARLHSSSPILFDEHMFCLGQKKSGRIPRTGDSGGPLITYIFDRENGNSYFYQIGIQAGSEVYTRVTEFLPWIQTHMSKNID